MASPPASHQDQNLLALAEAFSADNPAVFYTLLLTTPVLRGVTRVEDLFDRVGEEDELQAIVYLHFLKRWQTIRALAMAADRPVAGYLVETIRNAVRDALRKKERRSKVERRLLKPLDGRGNEADMVEDHSPDLLDQMIAREDRDSIRDVQADADLARFGAVYKLKMMMRSALDELAAYAMNADEAAWTPSDPDYPHPRPAGRVERWLVRLRTWDQPGQRFKPTSRKIVRMLGMVRSNQDEVTLKERANIFDQWFRRAKLKLLSASKANDDR